MSSTKLFCSKNLYDKYANALWMQLQKRQRQQPNQKQYNVIKINSINQCDNNNVIFKYQNNLQLLYAYINKNNCNNGIFNIQKIYNNNKQHSLLNCKNSCYNNNNNNNNINKIQKRAYNSNKMSTASTSTSTPQPPTDDIFTGVLDRFEGITVDAKNEFIEAKDFTQKLTRSLEYWIMNKKRAIWFHIYKEQAAWVPILAEHGFDFHHAKTGVVVMYRWLPENESNNLPNYAHTLLGVGGIVINKNNEILVVSDRYALIPNSWKLPGGYVEPRENLIEAAIREVREETGIETTFCSVVCLRHSHRGSFGCSDIYCVIGLEPKNLEFKRCEREIARLQWMPVPEFLEHPQVHETNRHFVRTYLNYLERGLIITCRRDVHQILKKEYNLYYVDDSKHA